MQSTHYVKQSRFIGSTRQVRGAIIRLLSERALSEKQLHTQLTFEWALVQTQLHRLEAEGLIKRERLKFRLP